MTALPNASSQSRGRGRPGGMFRFVVAMLITILVLGGVVFGMVYWMSVTSGSHEGLGPEKLTFPENRYYRQKPS